MTYKYDFLQIATKDAVFLTIYGSANIRLTIGEAAYVHEIKQCICRNKLRTRYNHLQSQTGWRRWHGSDTLILVLFLVRLRSYFRVRERLSTSTARGYIRVPFMLRIGCTTIKNVRNNILARTLENWLTIENYAISYRLHKKAIFYS